MAQGEEKKKFWVVELEKDPQIKNSIVVVNLSWVRGEQTHYPTDSLDAKDGELLVESFLKLGSFSPPEEWKLYSFKKLDCFRDYWILNEFKNFCGYYSCLTSYSYPQRGNN